MMITSPDQNVHSTASTAATGFKGEGKPAEAGTGDPRTRFSRLLQSVRGYELPKRLPRTMPFGKVLGTITRSRTPWRRAFTNVAQSPEVDRLPLSGIRVLDMTRVLAGVGQTL